MTSAAVWHAHKRYNKYTETAEQRRYRCADVHT